MKERFFAAAVIISSLFLFSCSQESPFLPVSGIEDSVVLGISVQPGRVLNPEVEDSIDIDFSYDETSVLPETLEVALLDSSGNLVGEPVIIEGKDLDGDLPSIDTASLEDGFYSVRLRVYDNAGQLIKETITPFFDSRIPIQIRGVDVYPPEFLPGSSGFLFPDVDAPGDVWIRWSLGDTILSSGLLDSYRQGLIWKAPESEGVYTVRMEVFPFPPVSSYGFSSDQYADIEIFVTDGVAADRYDLGSGENTSVLLNLNGTLRNDGSYKSDPYFIGSPVPKLVGSGFGYSFESGDGIGMDTNILPAEDGNLSPFSAVFRVSPGDSSYGKKILTVEDENGILFFVEIGKDGFYSASLLQESGFAVSGSAINFLDAGEVVVDVVPMEDSVRFIWYADGKYSGSSTSDYSPAGVSGTREGKTVLGGPEGFSGFIDYFGLYYRNSADLPDLDNSIFNRMVGRLPGKGSVVLAEGFDGLYLPEEIEKLNGTVDGLGVDQGALVVAPGYEAVLFESGLDFTSLEFDMDIPDSDISGELFFVLSDGTGNSGEEMVFPLSGFPLSINFVSKSGDLKITGKDGSSVLIRRSGNVLRAGIRNLSGESPIRIDSVLVCGKGRKVVLNTNL